MPKMTSEDWRALVEKYPQASAVELAKIAGKSTAAVYHAKKGLGLVLPDARIKRGKSSTKIASKARTDCLVPRRAEVLKLCRAGYSSNEIASKMEITVGQAVNDRSHWRRSGVDVRPSWDVLHARGLDASIARKLRSAPAGEAQAWADANGKAWPRTVRNAPVQTVEQGFPKPSYRGLSPAVRAMCEAENRAMRRSHGLGGAS